ncbi:MAG: dihydrolipoyl dehydrogenase [Treponema sp.]|jgi:dihydrolipoamide dehydrogenase|nr:dihydrolipoyl dehydrogenase [Treponema sp.]
MYDAIIIGGGPGGYLAAERLSQRGKKVLLVEKQYLGGTCLNVGCIPTKSLLNGAKLYLHAKEGGQFGIHSTEVSFNFEEMMAWKEKTVQTLCAGVSSKMKHCKVEVINGTAVLEVKGSSRGVRITDGEKAGTSHEARAVLVAAGSVPVMPPIPGAKDNPKVLDSTGLLTVKSVPTKLCVIGGGVIGMEFASLFSSLGSEVSVVEMLDEIIPPMDKDHAALMRRSLKGVNFNLGSKVTRIESPSTEGDGTVFFTTKDGEKSVTADLVLMAVGRRAELTSWGAKEAGIDIGPKGVVVDERMRTNISGVWAAGDVNGLSMLAHSAYRMAEVAVNDICAYLDGSVSRDRKRYHATPWVVYSIPEAAGIGLTEQEATGKGINIKKASLPMTVSGRFIAENGIRAPGNVKVIVDAQTEKILGIHLLGPHASEIIWGAAAIIENEMRVSDVKEMIFPHPTVSEVIREAIWAI